MYGLKLISRVKTISEEQKSCIWETLNLLTCADKNNNNKKSSSPPHKKCDVPSHVVIIRWENFHRIDPLSRFNLVVAMSMYLYIWVSVCLSVPFPCDSPRGAKDVPEEQSCLPPLQSGNLSCQS